MFQLLGVFYTLLKRHVDDFVLGSPVGPRPLRTVLKGFRKKHLHPEALAIYCCSVMRGGWKNSETPLLRH